MDDALSISEQVELYPEVALRLCQPGAAGARAGSLSAPKVRSRQFGLRLHSMRRTKPAQIYKKAGNLRAVQLLSWSARFAISGSRWMTP